MALTENTFGERVRAMRIEKGLSQDELAALMPSRRHNSWTSAIEKGKQEPTLADLAALAEHLETDVRWLVSGEGSGMTEFVARLREMELEMDERGRREVLASAERQVEEARRQRERDSDAEFERVKAALLAAGLSPAAIARAEQAARQTLRGSGTDTAE